MAENERSLFYLSYRENGIDPYLTYRIVYSFSVCLIKLPHSTLSIDKLQPLRYTRNLDRKVAMTRDELQPRYAPGDIIKMIGTYQSIPSYEFVYLFVGYGNTREFVRTIMLSTTHSDDSPIGKISNDLYFFECDGFSCEKLWKELQMSQESRIHPNDVKVGMLIKCPNAFSAGISTLLILEVNGNDGTFRCFSIEENEFSVDGVYLETFFGALDSWELC